MAELVIRKNSSWMDNISSERYNELLATYPNFQQKYNMRIGVGDVIAILPDKWNFSKKEIDNYNIVRVPGEPAEWNYLMEHLDSGGGVTLKLRKHRIKTEDFTLAESTSLSNKDKVVLSKARTDQLIEVKSG